MSWTFDQILTSCSEKNAYRFFEKSEHGLERECLRINKDGQLSQLPHPRAFGAKLTHPHISTDFSEAQLELITPYFTQEEEAIKFLNDLHLFIYHNLEDELLWPFSTPCPLPEEGQIPLADYGSSNKGLEKYRYRQGLSYRYGRVIQTLSGIHYNFSFSKDLLQFLHGEFCSSIDFEIFSSQAYLHLIRNFLRTGWLYTYLFGVTPVAHSSYFKRIPSYMEKMNDHTLYGEHATSLRLSNLGYYSKVQEQIAISYNDLPSYIEDLTQAIKTPNPRYERIGLFNGGEFRQLNENFLQNEAEHYSRIRPKPKLDPEEKVLDALSKKGIAYVEVRTLDINPFVKDGIELDQLLFQHVFMTYCLFKESPLISSKDHNIITDNQNKIALFGRKPQLRLQRPEVGTIGMKRWANEIFDDLEKIAELMDKNFSKARYAKTISSNRAKLENPNLTPSSRLLSVLKDHNGSFQQFGLHTAEEYKQFFLNKNLSNRVNDQQKKLAETSIKEEENLSLHDDFNLKNFEDMELSTQLIIREAQNRGVSIEVLDRKDNFIRLTKGRKVEYVKQGTKTSRDSYITYLLMENKAVTKCILKENGLASPPGGLFANIQDALNSYKDYSDQKIVVKPNFTNYGIGISFVAPHQENDFEVAIYNAFQFGNEVLVEKFYEGEEYRFLVIANRMVAICNRIPANVMGDGKRTIRDLIKQKNADPKCYKVSSYRIKTGKLEKEVLQEQGMDFDSIPALNQVVYLRKNTNVSTGGDSIDMTDRVRKEYHDIAVESARVVKATFCGVDMILSEPEAPPTPENHSIIELNFNPALWLHRYPIKGKKRYVEKAVLDELGF